MKLKIQSLLCCLLISISIYAQFDTHQGHPVILAKTTYTEYKVGNDWYKGYWSVAPQVEHDTLQIICYGKEEAFVFKTDKDSISFSIEPNQSKDFYVKLNDDTYAHTIISGQKFQANQLNFDQSRDDHLFIKYQSTKSPYLEELKRTYPINLDKEKLTDTEYVLEVLNWTSNRWDHNGNHSPSKNDAITILNEASDGQEFPCFAFAIVLRDQLNALDYKARTVYLKTQDAKDRKAPPGHVATEVYLDDLEKWVFMDAQFNVMPVLNGRPLNAVEFQNAISNHYDELQLASLAKKKTSKKTYVQFVYDYLYYLDTSLDNRYDNEEKHRVNGMRSMMLVPSGASNLKQIEFWNMAVDYCVYTNSIEDFYAKPK